MSKRIWDLPIWSIWLAELLNTLPLNPLNAVHVYVPVCDSCRLFSVSWPPTAVNTVALSSELALKVHSYLLIFLSMLVSGLGLPLAVQVKVTEEPTEYSALLGLFVILGTPTLSVSCQQSHWCILLWNG